MKNLLKIFVSGLFVFGIMFFAKEVVALTVYPITISSFSATPNSIIEGASSKITWLATSGEPVTCELSNPYESISGSSGLSVSPVSTTTYTLTCNNTNPAMQKTQNITISVSRNVAGRNLYINEGTASVSGYNVNFYPVVSNTIGASTDIPFYNSMTMESKTAKLDEFGNIITPATIPDTTWTEHADTVIKTMMPTLPANKSDTVSGFSYTFAPANDGPNGTYTAYRMIICADSDNLISESSENNCKTSCWSSVGPIINFHKGMPWGGCSEPGSELGTTKPNLTAAAPTPSTARVGVPVTFNSTVTNIGALSTEKGFSSFFQVEDSEGVASDLPFVLVGALLKDESAPVSTSHTFTKAGSYKVRVCADKSNRNDGGVIDESNEDDNCSNATTVAVSLPDLTASAPTIISGAVFNSTAPEIKARVGDSVTVYSTIKNVGASSTVLSFKNVFIKSETLPAVAANSTLHKIFNLIGKTEAFGSEYFSSLMSPLGSGEAREFSHTFSFRSEGTYSVIVCADNESEPENKTGQIAESLENNNCSAAALISVGLDAPSFPDLTASTPTQTTAVIGVDTQITSTIKNQGVTSTVDSFYNLFQVSSSSDGSNPTDYKVEPRMSALAPSVTAVTSISSNTLFSTPGKYYVRVCADRSFDGDISGIINEGTMELNNCSESWREVTVTEKLPTGTLTATNCSILEDASTCDTTLVWDTFDPVVGKTSAVTTPTDITVATGNSGTKNYTLSFPIIPGTRNFYLYHNEKELKMAQATASCITGTTWNGTYCSSLPAATGTLGGDDCEIIEGGKTCDTKLTINVINPVTEAKTNVTKSVPSAGTVVVPEAVMTFPTEKPNIPVAYGGTTFYLNHNSVSLIPGGKTINAKCAGTLTWNGTFCTALPVATGTLDGADCTIPENGSTCNTTLTIDIENPTAGAFTNVTKNVPVANTTVVPSAVIPTFPIEKSGISVAHGGTTFFLNHNSLPLSEKFVNATCSQSPVLTGWNSSTNKCVAGFIEETCNDGIKNQNETGIDTGGVCGGDGDGDGDGGGDVVDLCLEDEGIQTSLPCSNGDVCPLIDGIQTSKSSCPDDLCLEIDGIQTKISDCPDIDGNPLNVTLTASPAKIYRKGSSTLTWISNADYCVAVAGLGFYTGVDRSPNGSDPVSLNETTVYKIECHRGELMDIAYTTIRLIKFGEKEI